MAAGSAEANVMGIAPLPLADRKSAILEALVDFIERTRLRPGDSCRPSAN